VYVHEKPAVEAEHPIKIGGAVHDRTGQLAR
jgi:hypothetical protein